MQIANDTLIDELTKVIDTVLGEVSGFRGIDLERLNRRPRAGAWSALQCLEHLNLYGDYYLKEVDRRLEAATARRPGSAADRRHEYGAARRHENGAARRSENEAARRHEYVFVSGVIGNYFANLMKGKNGSIKKMKTPQNMEPDMSGLTYATIDRQIKQLELLKAQLERARSVDLVRTKTSIALTGLIKLRLGDTFRFMAYHIERHVNQAKAAVAMLLIVAAMFATPGCSQVPAGNGAASGSGNEVEAPVVVTKAPIVALLGGASKHLMSSSC